MAVNGLVSVIVPTYNRRRWLEQALSSVLAQTWPHLEILVCDDGSTDGTREYLASLDDPRVVVMGNQAPRGPAANIATALTVARGRYVAKLDDDDWWAPDFLERALEVMMRDPSIGCVVSDAVIVDDEGQSRGVRIRKDQAAGRVDADTAVRWAVLSQLALSASLYRMDVVRAGEALCVACPWAYDYYWVASVALKQTAHYYLPGDALYYRQHQGPRVTGDRRQAMLDSVIAAGARLATLAGADTHRRWLQEAMAKARLERGYIHLRAGRSAEARRDLVRASRAGRPGAWVAGLALSCLPGRVVRGLARWRDRRRRPLVSMG